MRESDFAMEARLIALEFLATHTYNAMTKLIGASEGQIAAAEREALNELSTNPVEDADRLTPAQKDHLSSEATLAIERLFEIAHSRR